jgi:hypothetical protein
VAFINQAADFGCNMEATRTTFKRIIHGGARRRGAIRRLVRLKTDSQHWSFRCASNARK